jgi:hypothetical protein
LSLFTLVINERSVMDIGDAVRTVIVEPLELPEPLRPAERPERVEEPEPQRVER